MSRNKLAAIASLLLGPAALIFVQLSCVQDAASWAAPQVAPSRAGIEIQFAARYCTSQYRGQSDIMRCLGQTAR